MSGNICTYQRLPKIVRYSESKDRLVKPAIRHSQSCLRNSSVKSVSVPPTQQPISSAEQRRLSHHTFTATSALNLVMAKFPAHHNLRGLPSCPLIQALSSVGLSCYKFHPSVAEEGGGAAPAHSGLFNQFTGYDAVRGTVNKNISSSLQAG